MGGSRILVIGGLNLLLEGITRQLEKEVIFYFLSLDIPVYVQKYTKQKFYVVFGEPILLLT